ncbi:MAG: ribosome biogenesis GTPase Der [Planctomycetes bacterium]|nr:ribosome biogenesis GTPase Der [Planctomycetota bacterium]
MNEPVAVICGRPNVGKSSLFNAMLRRRVAIVDPTAGVTRDRVAARVERTSGAFLLVDTGGIGLFDDVALKDEVESQIEAALCSADLVLLVVDVRDGVLPADEAIARELRILGKPILLVVNKCDGAANERVLGPFYSLGLGEPRAVSALERFGVEALVEDILERLPCREEPQHEEGDAPIRLAVVGKVNSGKSTLVNLLVGEQRVIVSEMPGTTRDAVDVPFARGGRRFIAVDTAGIRKRRVVEGTADFYAQARASEAIRRSDVVLLLIDAARKFSQIDKGIASEVGRSGKPVVIGVTKWDLARDAGKIPEDYRAYLAQQLPMLDFAPVVFLSAVEDFNVDAALDAVAAVYAQAGYRAPTGPLNRIIEEAETRRFPRVKKSRVPKILYVTQTAVRPPTIIVFVNDRKLFGDEYARYLANRLREQLPFNEVPLRIHFRDRRRPEA